MRFTTAQDEALVSKVSEFPPLFNKDHKLSKNVVLKNNLWADISKHVGRDVNECKKRWRDIKDNYFKIVRHLNRAPEGARKPLRWHLFDRLTFLKKTYSGLESENDFNGIGFGAESETPAEDALLLDRPSLCDVQLKSESYEVDDSNGDDSSLHSVDAADSRNRRATGKRVLISNDHGEEETEGDYENSGVKRMKTAVVEVGERNSYENDDVDYFMKSIALSVKKLPDFMVAKAKEKILKIVNDLQFPTSNT